MKDKFINKASNWENPRRVKMAETFIQALEKKITIKNDWECIEIGAGTGLAGLLLLSKLKYVVFEDTSASMLTILNDKVKNLTNVETFLGEATDYNARHFDLVISNMAFHHIEDIDGILKHIYSITKDEAVVAIADILEEDGSFHGNMVVPHNGFNILELGEKFSKAGFEVIHSEIFDVLKKNDDKGQEKQYERFLLIASKKRAK